MKLLFDQNISFRILKEIETDFPGSKQVREVNLEEKSDRQIWEYSKEHGFTIVTFDLDFKDFSNLYGPPPKVILLRTGNLRTKHIKELILNKQEIIKDFIFGQELKSVGCLEIHE